MIPQNEFLSPLGMKAEADNSNFNFSRLFDDVSFAGFVCPVSVIPRAPIWLSTGLYRGSGVRSPPVPVVLSVYQRGYLLDGLAVYLSCDTKKFHHNDSTHILHNFWTSTHRGEASPPLAAPL